MNSFPRPRRPFVVEKFRLSRVGDFSMPPVQTIIVDFADRVGSIDAVKRLERSSTVASDLLRHLTSAIPDDKDTDKD